MLRVRLPALPEIPPALTRKAPVKLVFTPVRLSTPAPERTRVPAPLMLPDMVRGATLEMLLTPSPTVTGLAREVTLLPGTKVPPFMARVPLPIDPLALMRSLLPPESWIPPPMVLLVARRLTVPAVALRRVERLTVFLIVSVPAPLMRRLPAVMVPPLKETTPVELAAVIPEAAIPELVTVTVAAAVNSALLLETKGTVEPTLSIFHELVTAFQLPLTPPVQ